METSREEYASTQKNERETFIPLHMETRCCHLGVASIGKQLHGLYFPLVTARGSNARMPKFREYGVVIDMYSLSSQHSHVAKVTIHSSARTDCQNFKSLQTHLPIEGYRSIPSIPSFGRQHIRPPIPVTDQLPSAPARWTLYCGSIPTPQNSQIGATSRSAT